jgi:Cu-Zn family superoxide dismutase
MKNHILFAAGVLLTCAPSAQTLSGPAPNAEALIVATAEQPIGGIVRLTRRGGLVQVSARLTGLSPGLHAFHLHQHGDCGDAGAAAGGHFDPSAAQGRQLRSEHHGGEFGALAADALGVAHLNMVLSAKTLALDDGPNGVIGRSIVVHTSPDDFIAWPAPTKGRTLACGAIRAVPPFNGAPT